MRKGVSGWKLTKKVFGSPSIEDRSLIQPELSKMTHLPFSVPLHADKSDDFNQSYQSAHSSQQDQILHASYNNYGLQIPTIHQDLIGSGKV